MEKCNTDSSNMIIMNVTEWKNNYLNSKSVKCKDRFQNINHPLKLIINKYYLKY